MIDNPANASGSGNIVIGSASFKKNGPKYKNLSIANQTHASVKDSMQSGKQGKVAQKSNSNTELKFKSVGGPQSSA